MTIYWKQILPIFSEFSWMEDSISNIAYSQ